MSQIKTKNKLSRLLNLIGDVERGMQNVGVVTMIVAAIVGMTELADRQDIKGMALQLQPSFALANNSGNHYEAADSVMRKEREEVRHQSVSYGVSMRSHATSGRA